MSSVIRANARDRLDQRHSTPRPRFFGAVRGEMLKIARQRATWVMVGLAILLFAVVVGALLTEPNPEGSLVRDPHAWAGLRLNIFVTVFDAGAGIFLLIASSRLVAMEYSAGTIRVLLGRGTGRLQLLGAQLLTLLLTGLALLATYLAASALVVYLMAVSYDGSFNRVAAVPNLWHDVGADVTIALISVGINILLGTAAAVVGRSLAFGLGAALAFFPADNFGTIIMALLGRLTNQHFWSELTAYLLGPNLNVLPSLLIPGQRAAFAQPLVPVDATHSFVVVGIYAALFLGISILLTARRDVLQ